MWQWLYDLRYGLTIFLLLLNVYSQFQCMCVPQGVQWSTFCWVSTLVCFSRDTVIHMFWGDSEVCSNPPSLLLILFLHLLVRACGKVHCCYSVVWMFIFSLQVIVEVSLSVLWLFSYWMICKVQILVNAHLDVVNSSYFHCWYWGTSVHISSPCIFVCSRNDTLSSRTFIDSDI